MSGATRVLVNGHAQTDIPVSDRGLQYGDGVFRTILVRNGSPLHIDRHIRHLAEACRRLNIPLTDQAGLKSRAVSLCEGTKGGVLKIILTRGVSGRGYRPQHGGETEILQLYMELPTYPSENWEKGVTVRVCTLRLGINPALAGIKHLNRLEQVLARAEWTDEQIAEGIMLDTQGHVIEATACNLFIVSNGVLETPDLSGSGVMGVMREMILEAASAYTTVVNVRDLQIEDCMTADELFLCNSIIGIWPVRRLQDRVWTPGPITKSLQRHFADMRR